MEEKVKEIMSRVFETSIDEIDDAASPDTIEKWDSLHHLFLVLALEEHFGITFSEDEIVEMLSFRTLVETLRKKGVA
jgi:acyl carrier protein